MCLIGVKESRFLGFYTKVKDDRSVKRLSHILKTPPVALNQVRLVDLTPEARAPRVTQNQLQVVPMLVRIRARKALGKGVDSDEHRYRDGFDCWGRNVPGPLGFRSIDWTYKRVGGCPRSGQLTS